MRTAVLILSVDEAERLETCLPAAARQGADAVVVVDNACTDHTEEVAREYGAVVRLPERRSYAAAMNAGLAAVREFDAVLLCNADCVLLDGALAALAARLEADAALAAVAPKLVREADVGTIDAAGMWIDRRRRNTVVGAGLPAVCFERAAEIFGADGACVLWRRTALDDCAPDGEVFDEELALWTVDADLAWRARVLGWRAAYEPRAVGRHVRFFGPSSRGSVPLAHRRLQLRNRLLMIVKNDRPRDLLRDAPHLLAYELATVAYAV
ncbi:MAG TPA: glycosyltransferase, partial [Solirubrobacteraceae bacterium]|nr:glycosyltransferase [Solirubrobacteraceae bacterium]